MRHSLEVEGAATPGRPYDAIEDHRRQAVALLPETAEAYFLRAMTAMTVKDQFAALHEALRLDSQHYESRRLRAFTYYASRKYDRLRDDALALTVLRPRDSLGYSLRAIALRELGKYQDAIAEYDNAIALTTKSSPQYVELSIQRCETLLRMGDYQRVVVEAQECLKLSPDNPIFQYYIFCALTALGDYDKADTVFHEIVRRTPTSRNELREWCAKYVFDTLEAGRSWHPADREPPSTRSAPAGLRAQASRATARDLGAAFLPMVEAEETYHALSAKGRRVTTDGFSAHWSPDEKKLAFSAGVHGYSGVAIFDPATKETELLIVPGKDPRWSPDGKYIAFVRDCQFLRVSEFIAAEQKNQHRMLADEEVWVMRSDGTEPRRLARGGWPSWSQDSTCIYYQSRVDNKLCSISITGGNVEPKQIMACSNAFPSVSPHNQHVAYLEGASLKIKDLTSQALVAEWPMPFVTWGGAVWSPTGRELCLAGQNNSDDRTGLWIYSLDGNEPARTLDGQITVGSWAFDGTKLVFTLGPPYFELWAADLDPNAPTIEALGPGQTPDEHFQEMIAFYNRRIEADPQDAYAYSGRAHYYDCLNDKTKAKADMRQWSAILSGSDLQAPTPQNIKRVISAPFGYQLVFSVRSMAGATERPVNEIPLLNVALGQKGRCNMKLFQIPMLSTRGMAMSLLGLCLLSGLDTPLACADFTFGEPVNLKSVIPVIDPAHESVNRFSSDGLEMYFESDRAGGSGGLDLWVSRRATIDSDWGPLENLGPFVNTANAEGAGSVSADGLTLYFASDRPGGYGGWDMYMTTRASRNTPWGPPVNMGPKVNGPAGEGQPSISADGLELFFISGRSSGYGEGDIYVTSRASTSDPWGDAVNLGPVVNSAYSEYNIFLSPDGLLLLFSDERLKTPRPGGYGSCDMWMTRRASLYGPWQAPTNLGPRVNSSAHEIIPVISPDGSMLYFTTNSAEVWDNWQAPIMPICDFNSDGIVDIADVFIMLEHWHTDHPLCDIGPFAWGDGIVDAQDLIVLAEYMAKNPGAVNGVQ